MRTALYQVLVAAISMMWGALSRIPKFGAAVAFIGDIGETVARKFEQICADVTAASQPPVRRGKTLVQFVCDGPEGYAIVASFVGTFVVPASLRSYYERCCSRGDLAHYEITNEIIDGVSVGNMVVDEMEVATIGSFAA